MIIHKMKFKLFPVHNMGLSYRQYCAGRKVNCTQSITNIETLYITFSCAAFGLRAAIADIVAAKLVT